MSSQNKLYQLLLEALINEGNARVRALQAVREYLQKTNCDILNQELAEIDKIGLLRMLQAAGVPQCLSARFFVQVQKAYAK
ncbi:MAG: hypothetical protein QXP36_08725 [Conexivisphaerales archaeon]|uniref:hypothetical protein n=1 Tax=Saccharolobus sp. TaxID=2100761 RepID=UPI00317D329B